MKVHISFTPTIHYDKSNIMQWVFMFERYTYLKGFKLRILGLYINVVENNAQQKLINIAHKLCIDKAKS